jgi:hypothetical protein
MAHDFFQVSLKGKDRACFETFKVPCKIGRRPASSINPKQSYVRDLFYEEVLIDHRSKIEFFGRLAAAADACLSEQPDATAHLVYAAVLRGAYSMAKQMDEDKFDFLIVAEGNQIADHLALPRQRIGYSSVEEMISFFCGRGIHIHGYDIR